MKNIWLSIVSLGMLLLSLCPAEAQNSPNCVTVSDNDYLTGRAFFNYGSVSNAFNTKMRVNVTVGQPVVGTLLGQKHKGALGFWSRFLMPPGPPSVTASEGDLEDRIQVDWHPDPLSPAASSYKIYRNGTLLASVDGETFSFIDFNVIAGKFYTYAVSGVNAFGEGSRNASLGFLNPNGVVTGQVKTFSGNPVPGAIVTLSPTLGASMRFNGNGMAFAEYNPIFPRSEFTLSAWVKIGDNNDHTSIFDMGSTIGKNWWLHTLPGGEKGIRFGIGRDSGDVTELDYPFPSAQGANWHYVTTTYNGASLLLYVDGELVATEVAAIQSDSMPLFFGQKPDASGFFTGGVDEVRFFNRQLAQTEIQMYMNQTVSANTPGLVAYWKFDEGVGSKAFDITENKSRIYFCGALWNTDKPKVVNAGVTDESGSYKIEGINYGAGTTFTARPSKDFFFNQSLEFNAVNGEYADLTSFPLSDSATVTLTAKAFDFSGTQALLSKADASGTNQFLLRLEAGELVLTIGTTSHSFGPLGMGFHHLVFTLRKEGANLMVAAFKDGNALGTHTFSATNWDGLPWKLGAQADGSSAHSNFFTGLVDEAAFFNSLLELYQIQEYANIGTNVTNSNLSSYFNLNEGVDSLLHDMGFALTGSGLRHGAGWSTVAAIMRTLPHQFTPSTKLATLNPSNTSVDQVDFTDQSTIPVSGYVRYEGTDCFVAGAEILVNGKRNTPAVFTDENGYFSIDLEPGASVQLSPTYNGHTFYPAFWEIIKASTPVAGILFRDQIKRTVTGQMAGNEICRKSVIPENAIVKVKVESLDGCYSKVLQLTETNGKYQFKNLPPIPMTVAVTEHSNNVIYNYFQLKGGATVDLTNQNDTVDFIYYAPPEIELSQLDTNLCGDPMLEQSAKYSVDIKVYQPYTGGNCYLDSADLTIVNDIQGLSSFDTVMTGGKLKYSFAAGMPNVAAPYLKTLTVQATANELTNTAVASAVVLGKRPRQVNFTSTSPDIPIMILRDPPGDGSSATIEKGTTVCSGWSIGGSVGAKLTRELNLKLGVEQAINTGVGVEKTTKLKVENTTTLGLTTEFKSNISNEMETCMTATETISTSGGDVLLGDDADVYVGGALNLLFGITDDLRYDTANCAFYIHKGLIVFPDRFATTFLYSGYQIKKTVIPNLEFVGDTASANQWRNILQYNEDLKKRAVFEKNFSFDAGVSYQSATSTEITKSFSYGFEVGITASIANQLGFEVDGLGASFKLGLELSLGVNTSFSSKETRTQTVSYSFADDDVKDVFTVDVLRDPVYGTPVFKTVSGNSSCPYESKTVPRDGVELSVDRAIASNVLANDQAVFKFNVGNISETDEYRSYVFELYNATNPNGAKVKIQGTESSSGVFGMSAGQSQEVIVTVERGPSAFEYNDLTFHVYSACEGARYDALGNGDFPPSPFYKALNVDVQFLEPCSPIDIGFPLE
ncbi:MAG: LamG-like jellyroll fold domain-containing protein, partial [Haliscomenobacter sp.]